MVLEGLLELTAEMEDAEEKAEMLDILERHLAEPIKYTETLAQVDPLGHPEQTQSVRPMNLSDLETEVRAVLPGLDLWLILVPDALQILPAEAVEVEAVEEAMVVMGALETMEEIIPRISTVATIINLAPEVAEVVEVDMVLTEVLVEHLPEEGEVGMATQEEMHLEI